MKIEDLKQLRLFLDGGDGSMWPARDDWDAVLADNNLASRRYVRLAELLTLFGVVPQPASVVSDTPEAAAPITIPDKPPGAMFWCSICERAVESNEVTYQNTHDRLSGGCGSSLILVP